jgi:hypothetical protein
LSGSTAPYDACQRLFDCLGGQNLTPRLRARPVYRPKRPARGLEAKR